MPEIISISDILGYVYCPRKLFLSKILGIKSLPNSKMIVGKLKHEIIEYFSKNEKKFIDRIDNAYDKTELSIMYHNFISELAEQIFSQNQNLITSMGLDKKEILKIALSDFSEDLKARIASVKTILDKGFLKEQIWNNLDKTYISELKLESPAYGLRGRVDRIEITKENEIIPFELKTRKDEMIYDSDIIQITAYAMLLEDAYKKIISKGFIESGKNKSEIKITQENKDKVLKLADEVRNLRKGIIPALPSSFSKCAKCDLQEACFGLK